MALLWRSRVPGVCQTGLGLAAFLISDSLFIPAVCAILAISHRYPSLSGKIVGPDSHSLLYSVVAA